MAKKQRPSFEKSKVVSNQPREAGDLATARITIRNQCLNCVGGGYSGVRDCESTSCWLFPWRFGSVEMAENVVREERGEKENAQ